MLTLGSLAIAALGLLVLFIMVYWKVFEKAGEAGWKCIIPVYGKYVEACIATTNTKLRYGILATQIITLLGMFLSPSTILNSALSMQSASSTSAMVGLADVGFAIMLISSIAGYIMQIIINYKLAQAFDQSRAFGIALAIAEPIAMAAIAFDKDIEYFEPTD